MRVVKIIGAAVLCGLFLASCAKKDTAQADNGQTKKVYNWKLTSAFPKGFPILGEVADKYAQWVKEMSNGQINIKVYGAGELVPALETFDAVSNGTVQVGLASPYYWVGKNPATVFFSTIPFGMDQVNTMAWLEIGGGMELWRELYAKYNLVPYMGGNTGLQMGGWFNKQINSIADLKGLKMRIPGVGGKVLAKVGGTPVLLAGSEIYTSLERGVIDATEWVGPYLDYKMGFQKVAKYYYTPGWHEPGTEMELMINKKLHDALPKHLQAVLEAASRRAQLWSISMSRIKNGEYLNKLTSEGVILKSFPDSVLAKLKKASDEVLQEMVANDPFSKKVYESYTAFQNKVKDWSLVSDKADIRFYSQ